MENLEEVRIKTIFQSRTSLFSLGGNQDSGEVVAKIGEVRFSEKDKPGSPIMRILVGDKRYYMHKNMSRVQDFELLKAVLSPNVNRINTFK